MSVKIGAQLDIVLDNVNYEQVSYSLVGLGSKKMATQLENMLSSVAGLSLIGWLTKNRN